MAPAGRQRAIHMEEDETMPDIPNVTPAELLKHVRLIGNAQREYDEAHVAAKSKQGVYRAAYKAAKKAGIDEAALKDAIRIHTRSDEATESLYFRNLGRYLNYMNSPLGKQFGLFDDGASTVPSGARKEHEEWEAHDQGYRAAQAGTPIDQNPHPPGSEVAQVWSMGWKKGEGVVKDVLAGNPAKPEKRRGRKAKGSDAIVAGAPA